MKKNNWKWLFVVLAGLIIFSIVGVSGIAVASLEIRKDQIVLVETLL